MIAKAINTPEKIRVLQKKLYRSAKAKPKRVFGVLYDKMYRMDILYEAWRQVRANKGSAGVDNQTIGYIQEEIGIYDFLINISMKLKQKCYKPQPVKRVYITKSNGGQRPLGIPTVEDRVIQTAMKLIIEPVLEARFKNFSYGFRPKRSCKDAVLEIRKYINFGCREVIDADIKAYFDSIPHDKLIKTVETIISDKAIIKLIKLWLKSGVMEELKVRKQVTGTPQGGVISPLLANLYLHWLDNYWEKQGFDKRWSGDAHLIRYADDFVILCKSNPEVYLQRARYILDKLGLTLNDSKTKIVNLNNSKQTLDFLGFTFRYGINRSKRGENKKTVYYYPTKKSETSIKAKLRDIIQTSQHLNLTELCKDKLNAILRGWSNYYIHSNARLKLLSVDRYCTKTLCTMLRKKHSKRSKGWRDHPPSFFYDTTHSLYCMSREFMTKNNKVGGYQR